MAYRVHVPVQVSLAGKSEISKQLHGFMMATSQDKILLYIMYVVFSLKAGYNKVMKLE